MNAAIQLAALTALAALLPAQQPHPDAAAHWMPQCRGAHWEFRVGRNGTVLQRSYDDEGEVDLPDGNRGHQLRRTTGSEIAFEYWSARHDGVFAYMPLASMDREPRRGVEDMPPACWLRAPLGIETHWQFDQPFLGQIAAGPGDRDDKPWPHVHYEATLVSPGEQLQLPAGNFVTAHVKITFALVGTDDPKPWSGSRELWFARGIGFVKQIERDRDGAVVATTELLKFAPGTAEPDPQPALQRWLAATPPWSQRPDCKPEPLSLGNASCVLFGRCYRLRWQQDSAFVHVLDGVVSPLSCDDAKGFAAMLQAHGRNAAAEDVLGAVAQTAALLACAARNLPPPNLPRPGIQRVSGAKAATVANVEGDVRDGTGVRGRAHASASCGADGKLIEVAASVRDAGGR